MNKVIILGDNHFNTLGVIRSLGEQLILPDVFVFKGAKQSWIIYSKYIDYRCQISKDPNIIVEELLKKYKNVDTKKYLIPTCDYAVSIVDDNYDVLSPVFIIPNVKNMQSGITFLMSKANMINIAELVGLKVPKTKKISVLVEGNYDFIDGGMQYPLILKQDKAYGTKEKIWVISDKNELSERLKLCSNTDILLQEYIEKDEEIGIQGVALGQLEDVIIPGIVHKLRTSDTAMGSTTYAILRKPSISEPITQIKMLMKSIGYNGIFDIELIRKDDCYYFIECNFRNGSYGYAYTQFGANLPLIWITLGDLPLDIFKDKLVYMNEVSDFKSVLTGKVSLLTWIRQAMNVDTFSIFNIYDLKPFFARIIYGRK